ncbi:MAG: hypothetical protein Q8L71_05505 [Thiobacillus sp.]|nr:hypothetical protein [Thiobacillus sp.]
MSWTLTTTAFFDRRARKFLTKHFDLRPRFIETMAQLRADPFEPSLRLHPLTSKLSAAMTRCTGERGRVRMSFHCAASSQVYP